MKDTLAERLERRLVRQPSGCLEWIGCRLPKGYGQIRVSGKTAMTHRQAWELAHGPIPDGLNVLHHCDNPPCCDVLHLFLGTQAENNADRALKGRSHGQDITHCPQDHAYDEINTVTHGGKRSCRECHRAANRAYYARLKEVTL
jgi:hypothetical protein